MKDSPIDSDKVDIINRDREEEASLHNNLYLIYDIERKFDLALKSVEMCINILTELHGERSKKLAGKYYEKANCLLSLMRTKEAIVAIEKTIDLHENLTCPKKEADDEDDGQSEAQLAVRPEKEINFNRIQYQSFMCSALFIANDFDRVFIECDKGIHLCNEFSFALLKPEANKIAADFKDISLKARAK